MIIKNEDIDSVLLAVPEGHRHLRLALTTKEETIVLHEAAVAAIVRAYVTVKTHPQMRAIKLISAKPEGLKEGYAADQLIESEADEAVIEEMTHLLSHDDKSGGDYRG
ncbi:MAG: hypothetical protein WA666_01720 [Nitrospirota bacterium]